MKHHSSDFFSDDSPGLTRDVGVSSQTCEELLIIFANILKAGVNSVEALREILITMYAIFLPLTTHPKSAIVLEYSPRCLLVHFRGLIPLPP